MNTKILTLIFISCAIFLFSRPLNAQTTGHTNSLNRYSFDLYHEVKSERENFLLSPLSTYYTLLMAYEGSKNNMKQEFGKVLYIWEPNSVKNGISYLLQGKQDNYNICNAIWIDKGTKIKEEYKNSVKQNYSSDFLRTDFKDKASAVSDINGWVSGKTNRKINEIIEASDIGADTRLLISNVVYFKAKWLHQFDKNKTITGNFYPNSQDLYEDVFMTMTDNLKYYENELFQFISKPYKEELLSFCIILPKDMSGLEAIEKTVNADSLDEILENARDSRTLLYIPKINLESSYELSSALKKMGLQSAFSDGADFSGITGEVPVKLEQVLHKAVIELDEEKTEAAAATAQTTYIMGRPSYKIFKADHPFMFFVIDHRSKAILFMGRYMKPTGKNAIIGEDLTHHLAARKKEPLAGGWSAQKILYMVDGKIYKDLRADSLDTDNIESINVIKDKEKMRKYSQGDYDGMIIITLKKKKK